MAEAKKNLECGRSKEQRSPARVVSGAGSLKSGIGRGGACFSPRPRQRASQDPLTRQGGDALRAAFHYTTVEKCTGRSRVLAHNMVGYLRQGMICRRR